MHALTAILVAAALTLSQTAAAETCVGAGDLPAFRVQALKSEMMLTAVGCGSQAGYNAVVRRFRGDISANEHRVMGWFARAYGGHGRARYDSYISELANVQSLAAVRELGAGFCEATAGVFPDILKLKRGADFVAFADRTSYAQPAAPPRCDGAGGTAPSGPQPGAVRTPASATPKAIRLRGASRGDTAATHVADRVDAEVPVATSMHRPPPKE